MDQYLHYRDLRMIKEKGAEILFKEIVAENFPNLGTKTDIQIQEAPNAKQDESKETHGDIIINLSEFEDEERILKAARESNLFLTREST